MTSKPTDLAYAAGFFDGEGSIMILPGLRTAKSNTHPRLLVSLAQVDRVCLDWLVEKFGGKIRVRQKQAKGNCRVALEWYLCGVNAADFLRRVRPYLVLKAHRADLAMEFRKTVQRKGGIRVPVAAEVVEQRERLRLQMKELNRRGVVA